MRGSLLSRILGIPRDGAVERRRQRTIRDEQKLRKSLGGGGDEATVDTFSNAETSVLVSVNDTLAGADAKRAARLLTGQSAVIRTAHRCVTARQRLRTAQADARWVNHDGNPDRPGTADDAAARQEPGRFRESFDPHRPLIAERTLLIIELIFVVVEFFFWYRVFAEDVSRSAPWYDPTRVGAVLLAVLLPMSGIIAARVIGGLTHRWVSEYRYIGRREKLGTLFSLVLAALSLVAVYQLVHDRFDAGHKAIGTTQLSASAMALVFIVVLLGDMMARVFLLSEIRKQTVRWTRRLNRLTKNVTAANEAHVLAWVALRSEASTQLDRCERIVGAGMRIITDTRATSATTQQPPQIDRARAAHAAHADGTVMAVPDTGQLSMFSQTLALGPLRCVADAIDTLRRWQPLAQAGLDESLDPLVSQLYRLRVEDHGIAVPRTPIPHSREERNGSAVAAEDHVV